MMSDPKIIIALDFHEKDRINAFVQQLDPKICRLKVGKELFTRFGPAIVQELQQKGFEIFLDLKFHDIPNTVAKAVTAAAELGVWMINVHALGGRRMLEAAKNALQNFEKKPKLIAVTILTSLENTDLEEVGLMSGVNTHALQLAKLSYDCGLDGVVCSAQEASIIREATHKTFCLVTPGIRLSDDNQHDQRRLVTPVDAIKNGANYLVIGRSITHAKDPMVTLNQILQTV